MLTELAALLDLLKSKGVSRARLEPWNYPPGKEIAYCGVIDVTFAAPIDKAPPEEKSGKSPDDCRCGHAHAEHTNGLCIAGCEVEACAPEET